MTDKKRQTGKHAHKNQKINGEKKQQKNTNGNVQEKATKTAKQIPSGT
jgi:hypothetical protein